MESLSSATPMAASPGTGGGDQREIPRKALVVMYFFVGLLFIIGVPLSFYSYPSVNYNIITVGVVFGLIVLAGAFWDWRGAKAMKRSAAPYLMVVLGLVSIFLFSYTFSTPWVATYHLYIFPIDLGSNTTNAYYVPSCYFSNCSDAEYNVQNYLSAISTLGGFMMLLGSVYEVSRVRKMS